jgi:signal transduction histidine kinase/ActR/RegA family two-component response regulator
LAAATILGYLLWEVVPHQTVVGWWVYMVVLSAARFTLAHLYRRSRPSEAAAVKWGAAYAAAAGLAGLGWGAAGVLLHPPASPVHQIFLVFAIGGMMLGASTVLAPRPEAFLAFLVPAGLGPAARLMLQGDTTYLGMGLLAAIFTAAILATTWRIYRPVHSALELRFQNWDLIGELRAANARTEALNAELEARVRERTAELHQANELLRSEIDQRARMEEELLRARKLESLGVLAGGIAHDLNNFLTVVQGNVGLAMNQLESGDPVLQLLEQAVKSCERGAFLASQLLTFAKGGAPVRRAAPVDRLIMNAVHLARAGASVSFDVEIADDLLCAEVDPNQMSHVLHNILLNARQAMPDGGIIEVRAKNVPGERPQPGSRVQISIRDYGAGIPDDVLPRIFDPYFTTKPGATGLGLATAYAIVTKHGGRLTVESTGGSGTMFIIDLPASRERPAPDRPPGGLRVQGGNERLLVMDDEEGIRKLLETVLGSSGFEVRSARDGAEAIALYEAAKQSGRGFDAALLDLTVSGGMGGIEAAAKIRELDPSARLIVSSGYSDAPVMSEFRHFGFDAVLPKPWSAADLAEVLLKVLAASPGREPNGPTEARR